jgi:hypothetical protein
VIPIFSGHIKILMWPENFLMSLFVNTKCDLVLLRLKSTA